MQEMRATNELSCTLNTLVPLLRLQDEPRSAADIYKEGQYPSPRPTPCISTEPAPCSCSGPWAADCHCSSSGRMEFKALSKFHQKMKPCLKVIPHASSHTKLSARPSSSPDVAKWLTEAVSTCSLRYQFNHRLLGTGQPLTQSLGCSAKQFFLPLLTKKISTSEYFYT